MNDDEQTTLLREIRDILQRLTDNVDAQWAEQKGQLDRLGAEQNKTAWGGTVAGFILAAALFALLAYLILRH